MAVLVCEEADMLSGGELSDRVLDLFNAARALSGVDGRPGADRVGDARAALGAAWDLVTTALRASAPTVDLGAYLDLLEEIKQADQELLLERMRHRDASLDRVREALAMLRHAESTGALLGQAAEAVCVLGFDRSILSRIEESAWFPENVCVGRKNPQVLDWTQLETEMVRRRVPILVHDVQEQWAVNRAIAEASLSRSYVAAPLIADGDVVGFLHADCYYQQRELNDFDRRVLNVFAEGLAQALSRTALLDRLAAVRIGFEQVGGALAAVTEDRVRLGGESGAAARAGTTSGSFWPAHQGGAVPPRDASGLSQREMEVVRLMAAGATNNRIACRLVISEGTGP